MKYCSNCGAQLPDDARFCGDCGTPVGAAPAGHDQAACSGQEAPVQDDEAVQAPEPDYAGEADGTVRLCQDGKYRWVYELNMFKSTAILRTLFKIFGFIFVGIWLFVLILGDVPDVGKFTLSMLLVYAGFCVFILLCYGLVALGYGGKYCVLFEMDEEGLNHIQLPKQFKKAQVAGWIAVLAGVLAGSPGARGAGILGASRNSLYSAFSKVRSIKANPGGNLIRVNAPFSKNQVYVEDADFDFVLDFIRSHCPKAD